MNDYRIFLLSIVFLVSTPISAMTFSTWAPWEIDSAVTAWYLKRHAMPGVVFQSRPKGTSIEYDASIDIPDSPYRRDAKNTAFDSAVKMHSINSFCIEELTKIVRLLELAPWRKSTSPEAEAFEQGFLPLLPKQPAVGGLEQAFKYLDRFCVKENKQ